MSILFKYSSALCMLLFLAACKPAEVLTQDAAALKLIKAEQARTVAYIAKRQATVAATLKKYGIK